MFDSVRGICIVLLAGVAVSAPSAALAATYVVTDAGDPNAGNGANCVAGSATCTLRDALAAADGSAAVDKITFDIDETIYLKKQLTAYQPVAIDGGKQKTEIRVDQGHYIALLLDRPAFGNTILPVLQPMYYSENGSGRSMLNVLGHGSLVTGIILDGSITVPAGAQNVERIDYESDNQTDYLLQTVAGRGGDSHWLIAGGLRMATGSAVSNVVRHVNNRAIHVEGAASVTIRDNHIYGGAADQSFSSADGLWLYQVGSPVVEGNRVDNYRTGIRLSTTSGANVANNDLTNTIMGVQLEFADNSIGGNRIHDNRVIDSQSTGIQVSRATHVALDDNDIRSSGYYGIDINQAGLVRIEGNTLRNNGVDPTFDGGIRLQAASHNSISQNKILHSGGYGLVLASSSNNSVTGNMVMGSIGGGIILFENSTGNLVDGNKSNENDYGVLAASFSGTFPSGNMITNNKLKNNRTADAADFSPFCANYWNQNTSETVISAAPGCVDD